MRELDLERGGERVAGDVHDLDVLARRGDIGEALHRLLFGHEVDARYGRVGLDARLQREDVRHPRVILEKERELDLRLEDADRRLQPAIGREHEGEEQQHQTDGERRSQAHHWIAPEALPGREQHVVQPRHAAYSP